MARVVAYQPGVYPRSEDVVAATRALERGRTTPDEVAAAYRRDLEDFVAVQQEAGLDLFSDGLLRWQDLFRPLVEASSGMDARTLVRWFDNNAFFRAPEVTGDLGVRGELPAVLLDLADAVPQPRAATLPSPYLFSRAAHTDLDRNALMMDLAREVLAPVAKALAARGYALIHLQEPWLAYFGMDPADWDDLEKALSELHEAIGGAADLVLHTYYGDVSWHVDRLRRLPVDAVGIDFVQTDLDELGSNWEVGLFAGILDGRSSPVESAEGTADFAVHVAETLQPPALFLSANCDLEFLPQPIARRKVLRLGEAAALVKERWS
jgi:5-methyltetrahydropteroyltriglutamate--homocysteine methyltransferase